MRRQFVTKPPKRKRIVSKENKQRLQTEYVRLPRSKCTTQVDVCIENQQHVATSVEQDISMKTDTTYLKKRKQLADAWGQLREELIKIRIEELAPATFKCVKCNGHQEEIIRCSDCSAVAYYCHGCCNDIHSTVLFHSPCIWKGEMFIPLKMETKIRRIDHACGTIYSRDVCLIDSRGVQQKLNIGLCNCEAEAITAIRYGMWPGTPERPNVLFHLDLMEIATVLQMESHLSIKSFCDALSLLKRYQIYAMEEVYKDIYRVLVGDCSNEYRYHRTMLSTGKHFGFDCDKCPACNEDLSQRVICVDGNFGLVHKKAAGLGQGLVNARHKGSYFFSQDEVDTFVNNYQNPKMSQDCSSFQAGSILRSKVKNSKLDVTGVFGSVCKHDIPLKFCNLRHGERLAYAVYFLKCFNAEHSGTPGTSLFMYDISCMLHRHLMKNNSTDLLSGFKFVVPVFHSFAHNLQCQLLYGQKNVENTGLADGEGTERLWSFLRPFSKMTKEMSMDNRHDLFVDALHHYSEKLKSRLPDRILSRHLKAVTQKESSLKLLQNIGEDDGWSLDQIAEMYEERKRKSKTPNIQALMVISSEEEYCWELVQAASIRNQLNSSNISEELKLKLQSDLDKIERYLSKFERKEKISQRFNIEDKKCLDLVSSYKLKKQKNVKKIMKELAVERCYLLFSMKKYADGQDIAVRIGKQLQSINLKINNNLKELNKIGNTKLAFCDVSSPESTFYDYVDRLTFSDKETKALECFASYKRATEELEISKIEMQNVINHLQSQENTILEKMNELNAFPQASRLDSGRLYLLFLYKMQFEASTLKTQNLFSSIIDIDLQCTPVIKRISENIRLSSLENILSSDVIEETLDIIATYENNIDDVEPEFENEVGSLFDDDDDNNNIEVNM